MAEMSFREALGLAISQEMERDDQVFIMGEEVALYQGAYKVTQGLLEKFGEKRVVDAPITEAGFVGLGIGAAHVGMRPIIEVMTYNFAILALDQIINNAAKLRYMSGGQFKVPMVLRGPAGAGGALGSQHSQSLEQQYVHIPGLKVVMPSRPNNAKALLKASIRDNDPVIFIESEKLYNIKGEVNEDPEFLMEIGKAEVVKQADPAKIKTGNAVTILTWSRMLTAVVLPAVEILEGEWGISCEVVDVLTLSPLDYETLENSVRKTGRCIIVEEGWPKASVGSWIQAEMFARCFDDLDAEIVRLNQKDVPMPYAFNLEEISLPRPMDVVEAAKKVCYVE